MAHGGSLSQPHHPQRIKAFYRVLEDEIQVIECKGADVYTSIHSLCTGIHLCIQQINGPKSPDFGAAAGNIRVGRPVFFFFFGVCV